jgi:hypothetical protein
VRGPYTAYAAATRSRPVVPRSLSPFQTPKMLPTYPATLHPSASMRPQRSCHPVHRASSAHRPVGAYDAAAVKRVESDLA